MSEEPRFLRPDVIIEPLVDRFYAWLLTVAPVQAAMNLAFLQVPLLESYLQSPQVHINASRNPELRGGFFVNIEDDRSGESTQICWPPSSVTGPRCSRFAAAVAEAEEIVRQGATGFDLTPLYPKLPTALSGLVELAYDTNNQASMRFIEPLVYESSAYTEDRQSVQLSLETGAERPFILSTPRLPSPDVLDLRIPFRHPGLEELFRRPAQPAAPGRAAGGAGTRRRAGRPAERAAGRRAGPGQRPAHRRRRTDPLLRARLPGDADAGRRDHHRPVGQLGCPPRRTGTPTATCPTTSTWR